MNYIENQCFDKERALYGSKGVSLSYCRFDGPADGESALKESRDIIVSDCWFNLRYPFWHDNNVKITNCEMTSLCRAALWYSGHILVESTKMHGIKALRECHDIKIKDSDIVSPEFGWSVNNITIDHTTAEGEYFMLRSENMDFTGVRLTGKYSFQYIKNAQMRECVFKTKDAFWHCENVTVRDSVINGEYLGWYSDGLTLIKCKISGTQPFCYCKNLKLIDCEMTDADLSFEKSDVDATLTAPVISIKNPHSGSITLPSVGELIMDDPEANCRVVTTE